MINVLISAYSDIIYLLIQFIDLFNIQNLMINVLISAHSDVIHLLVHFSNLLYYILNVYGTTLYYY